MLILKVHLQIISDYYNHFFKNSQAKFLYLGNIAAFLNLRGLGKLLIILS